MKYTFIALLAALLQGFTAPASAQENAVVMTTEQASQVDIETARPKPATSFSSDRFPAQVVVPNDQQRVISITQAGMVEVMLVAVGDHVDKDQPVARIQSPELIGLQSDFLQARTQLHLAKTNLDRDEQLHKEGIIAERRYLESRSKYEELRAVMERRRQALKLAGMADDAIKQLQHTQKLSADLTLRAPMEGIIMEQMATAGQRIDASTALYSIASLDPLWLEIHIPFNRASDIKLGDQVQVAGSEAGGQIITIGSEVHTADQGILLRANINQGAGQLRPGQFVETVIICDCKDANNVALPRSAIVRLNQRTLVFVQTEGGYVARDVKIEQQTKESTIVSGDLNANDNVAISGTATLKAALSGIGGSE